MRFFRKLLSLTLALLLVSGIVLPTGLTAQAMDHNSRKPPQHQDTVTSITVNTLPSHTEYKVGDKLSLDGLTVKLHYGDNSDKIINFNKFDENDITAAPADGTELTAEGKTTVTLTHGKLTATFDVNVTAASTDVNVTELTVNTLPAKLEYTVGEKLDLTGLTAKLRLSDDSSFIYTPGDFADKDITVTPAHDTELTTEGKTTVTLAHNKLTATFEINVLPAEEEAGRHIDRIFGSDRYETALAISAKGWESAETVILASGNDFADALAGAPLSKALDAPVLLVSGKDNTHVYAEIKRLGAENIIILGGENAVSAEVEQQLRSLGMNTERLSGSDRYATAAAVAGKLNKLIDKADKALIVSGESFADALSAAYAAAVTGSPILYTNSTQLNETTSKHIAENGINEVTVIGGPAAVSDNTAQQLGKLVQVNRVSGEDRYATSLMVARMFFDHTACDTIAVATGKDFPDALTGGAYAVKLGAPVLLVEDEISEELLKYLDDCGISSIVVFGGESAVSSDIISALK